MKQSVLLLVLFAVCVNAMHEDQAGLVDWGHNYIGRVADVHFSNLRKRFFAFSDVKNTIASINARTGELVWRQSFEEGERINFIAAHGSSKAVLSVSDDTHVRVLRGDRGVQAWELRGLPHILDAVFARDDAVVLTVSSVEAFFGQTGRSAWKIDVPAGTARSFLDVDSKTGAVHAVIVGEKEVRVIKIDTSSGRAVSNDVVFTSQSEIVEVISLGGPNLAILDKSASHVHLVVQGKKNKHPLKDVVGGGDGVELVQLRAHGAFAVRGGATTAVLRADASAGVSTVHVFSEDSGRVIASGEYEDGSEGFVAAVDTKALRTVVTRVAVSSGEVFVTEAAALNRPAFGRASAAFLDVKDDKSSHSLVIVSEDHSLALMRSSGGGKVVWIREEAMATILQAEFVALPADDLAHLAPINRALGIENTEGVSLGTQFTNRIALQLLNLQAFVKGLSRPSFLEGSPERVRSREVHFGVHRTTPFTGDQFGFRQLIVCSTAANKVIALSSEDGRVIWTKYQPLFAPSQGHVGALPGENGIALFPTRGGLSEKPQMLLLGKDAATGMTRIGAVNPLTGMEDETEARVLPFAPAQAFFTPWVTQDGTKVVAVVDTGHHVHVVPEGETGRLAHRGADLFFYTVEDGRMEGHLASAKSGGFETSPQLSWSRFFPTATETIVSVTPPIRGERVEEAVRILGDKSVLYKHINTNLIVVATLSRDVSHDGHTQVHLSGKPAESTVHIYFVDAVTGAIVYHTFKPKASGPVSVLVTENTVLFQYWSIKHMRWEVGALDMYDSQDDTANRDITTFSAFTRPQPVILRQSYIFPHGVKKWTVTQTQAGITSKTIVMALETNQVAALPRKWVDTRRPISPTDVDQAEGLLKYAADLHIQPTSVLSYNKTIEGVNGIVTAPCKLESHSLVFVHGLDLFFTRLTPSNTFDKLDDNFQRSALVATIAALLAVFFFSSSMARRKALSLRWE